MLNNIFYEYLKNGLFISFLILLTLILSPILNKRYHATWRLGVWKIYTICLMVPISCIWARMWSSVFPKYLLSIVNFWNVPEIVNTPTTFEVIAKKNQVTPLMKNIFLDIDWLPIIWITGMCIYIIYLIIGYIVFRRNIKMCGRFMDEPMQYGLQETLFQNTNRKRPIQVYWCQNVVNPFITGVFRQIIVLPDKNYEPADLKMIMEHELVHYMKRDLWWKGVFVVILALNWYNPLIHIMNIALNRDMELCCDSAVIRNRDKEFIYQYSDMLLRNIEDAISKRGVLYVSLSNEKKTLEHRFKNIFDKKLRLNKMVLSFVVILILATGSFAFGDDRGNGYFENQQGYKQLLEKAIEQYQENETERLNSDGNIVISNYKEKEARYTKDDGTVDYEKLLKEEEGIVLDDWIAASDKFYEKKYGVVHNSIEPHVLSNAVKATYYSEDGEAWKLKKGNKVKIKIYADTDYFKSDGILNVGYIENKVPTEIEKFEIKKEKEVEFSIPITGEYKFYLECAASQPIIIKWIDICLE